MELCDIYKLSLNHRGNAPLLVDNGRVKLLK